MERKKKTPRKCSGRSCPMDYTVDISKCQCTETCPHFTNETGFETIIDLAMMRFKLNEEDRKDLQLLFMAYVGEYIKQVSK